MKLLSSDKRIIVLIALIAFTAVAFGYNGTIQYSSMLDSEKVKALTVDSATGSMTIDSIPDVSNVQFVNGTDYTLTSTLTPDNTEVWGVNFTIDHNGQMSDLLNVTVWIYDDSIYGATYNSAAPDGLQLIRVGWVESTDTWSISQGSFTEWTEQSSIDPGSASSATSYDFTFLFDISRAARYDTDWNVTVAAFDDDDDSDSAAETGLVTMAQNFEISFSTATFSWGTVEQNSVNNTHGSLSLNIRANDNWEILVNATDWNTTLVDIEAQNIVALDQDGSVDGASQWIRNTRNIVTFGTWDAQSPMSTESAFTRNVYIFLSTSTYFTEGNYYEIIVYMWIRADT